ncbi:MAG: hypothetical protein JXQ99_22565 [Hyphomicrobiaceae bacterium]
MPEFTLTAQSAFSKRPAAYNGIQLTAFQPPAIASMATPNGGEAALAAALQAAYGIDIPPVGRAAISAKDSATFLRHAPDQMFVLFMPPASGKPTDPMAATLGDTAYLTDQSDSWAALRIEGPLSRAALERICPLDLAPGNFPPGTVARTVMEHLGIIMLCEAGDKYLLLSARSSADNFLHAVETSVRNVT